MVFATAFIAGAVAAVGINRALDVHLAQAKPKVECEPIFVALRSLPSGTPVTIWDVALRDWPKAMMPSTALRANDHFEGLILRHPVREGQPLLSVQLARAETPPPVMSTPSAVPIVDPAPQIVQAPAAAAEADLWAQSSASSTLPPPPRAPSVRPEPEPVADAITSATPTAGVPTMAEPVEIAPAAAAPAEAVSVMTGPPAKAPVVEPQPTPPMAAAQPVVRYLVVPERIAMQADSSFVTTARKAALAAAAASAEAVSPPSSATSPAPTSATSPAPTAVSPAPKTNVPPVVQHPGNRRPQSPPMQPQRSPQAVRQRPTSLPSIEPSRQQSDTIQRYKPVQPATPSRSTPPETGEQPPAKRPAGMFGSMFPNLRAGIDAVETELQSMRKGRPDPKPSEAAARLPRKTKPQPPSQNAAGWPQMGTASQRAF